MFHIGIDAPLVPKNGSFIHEATSWQISRTKDFNNELLAESLNDNVNLLDFYVMTKLEPDEVVFARAKVHYSDGTSGEWSRIITVSGNQSGFKLSNTIIITPEVFIDSSTYDAKENGLKVRTSPYKLYSGVGEHKSTTWEITTILGDVVWSRKEDEENLTSITIPRNKINDLKFYILKVTYHSDTNSKSNQGKLTFASGKTVGGI